MAKFLDWPGLQRFWNRLKTGSLIPGLAENLASWAEDLSPVSNSWDQTFRSTAGDVPIETTSGGTIQGIKAKTDFKCAGLRATAYNQLRLASNGGGAVAVGSGWYFPVPKLEYGQFGDATYNNGLLLTDNNGNNIQNATVYFKPLASGIPTSVTDGTPCSYQTVSFGGKTYRTYITPGEGWLIVSGITWANTCAHLAWEDWYDKFVAPDDAEDVGDYISLTALFSAAPNGTGKFLALGNIYTYAERTDATHMRITDPIARVTSPVWTNTLQDDGVTYKHELIIAAMKENGQAAIEESNQVLSVSGTTVSYTDQNATAIEGAVRYELPVPATVNVTLAKTAYSLNDCGVEAKEGAEGTGYMICSYSQNVADALSQIAKYKVGDIAAEVENTSAEIVELEEEIIDLQAQDPEIKYGQPRELMGHGTPQESNVPDNWVQLADGGFNWIGKPAYVGQKYYDQDNSTGSGSAWMGYLKSDYTLDWKAIN